MGKCNPRSLNGTLVKSNCCVSGFFCLLSEEGHLNPGERHLKLCHTRDDGTVTLYALHAATVLSRNCCADFGRPLAKKVMLNSHDGPGVTASLQTNIVPLTAVWNPPLSLPPRTPEGFLKGSVKGSLKGF